MNNSSNYPLGIVLSTVTDTSLKELCELGQQAQHAGFSCVYVNEGRGDAIASAMAIAASTTTIKVGTNIANIYFRHAYLAGHSARAVAEFSGGRFVLGLGMSHRALLRSLGIEMGDARQTLETYVESVHDNLYGKAGSSFLATSEAPFNIPVMVAGNTIESAAVAGRVGDGLMPFLSPLSYLPLLVKTARDAAEGAGKNAADFATVISIPTFISDDLEAARSAARYNLAFFAALPNYRRQWRRAGYAAAMDQIKALLGGDGNRREAAAAVPDELIDDVCVFGSAAQCRRQLDAFNAAGADEPVIAVSPVNEDRLSATRAAIDLLGGD